MNFDFVQLEKVSYVVDLAISKLKTGIPRSSRMDKGIIITEITYKASRSSGAGGQHVNKVSTKVDLSFDIARSQAFSEEEKARLLEKLRGKLTKEGILQIQCQETRSQSKNKKVAIERLFETLTNALIIPKRRKKSRPSKAVKEKRLKSKRMQSEKKANRKQIRY